MADNGAATANILTWNIFMLQVCLYALRIQQTHSAVNCPADFVGGASSCYYFSKQSDNSVTWTGLAETCSGKHADAHTVVIESAAENTFLYNQASQLPHLHDVWIGSSSGSDQPWYSHGKEQMAWYWTDTTSSAGFWNWDPALSNFQLIGSSEKCAIFYAWKSGLWGAQACHSHYGYICELDMPDGVATVSVTTTDAITTDITTTNDVATTASDVTTTRMTTGVKAISSATTAAVFRSTGVRLTSQLVTQTAAPKFPRPCGGNGRRDLVFYRGVCADNITVLGTVPYDGIIACARQCQQVCPCDAFLPDDEQRLCQLLRKQSQTGDIPQGTTCYMMRHGNES